LFYFLDQKASALQPLAHLSEGRDAPTTVSWAGWRHAGADIPGGHDGAAHRLHRPGMRFCQPKPLDGLLPPCACGDARCFPVQHALTAIESALNNAQALDLKRSYAH